MAFCQVNLTARPIRDVRCASCIAAIPSSCLTHDTVQHLIVSKEALPVPPAMCDILDLMHCWGRDRDPVWHVKVVDWLCFLLVSKNHLPDQMALRDCVKCRIRSIILEMGDEITPFVSNNMIAMWRQFFDNQCKKGNTHFFHLAINSFHFVKRVRVEPVPVLSN